MRLKVEPVRLAGKILGRLLEEYKLKLVISTQSAYASDTRSIHWRPRDGFTVLLHEAAHAALRHKPTRDRGIRLLNELNAWLWAESACYLWGLPFDYKFADRCFSTYASHVTGAWRWRIKWSHR